MTAENVSVVRSLGGITAERQEELVPIFFQASLVPYLLFLYFLSYRGNRIPNLANFGFQFLLVFVFGTVIAGILAKTMFDSTLANVDWLHGSAESLLTISNIVIVSKMLPRILLEYYDLC
jgi:hypothetical protein